MPIYEGPTIDEAISKGLHALGMPKEEVDIEILADAKKGFLGMGKKDAKVSIEPTKNDISEEPVESVGVPVKKVVEEENTPLSDSEELSETTNQLVDLDAEEAIKELALYLTDITKGMGVPALVKIQHESN